MSKPKTFARVFIHGGIAPQSDTLDVGEAIKSTTASALTSLLHSSSSPLSALLSSAQSAAFKFSYDMTSTDVIDLVCKKFKIEKSNGYDYDVETTYDSPSIPSALSSNLNSQDVLILVGTCTSLPIGFVAFEQEPDEESRFYGNGQGYEEKRQDSAEKGKFWGGGGGDKKGKGCH